MSFILVILGSVLLPSLLLVGQEAKLPSPIDPNTPIMQEESPVAHDCKEGDWALWETPAVKSLLSDYDFGGWFPLSCKAMDAAWLPTARVIRVHGAVGLDDYREITLLRASPHARVWLIPIEKGMVGYPDTPSDPHHLAAFNDLLTTARLKLTDQNIFEVSNLYQFIVGMAMRANPRPPATLKDAFSVNDIAGQIEHKDRSVDFTHREPYGDNWSSEYMVWEFRYSTLGDSARLIDVERKTLTQCHASE